MSNGMGPGETPLDAKAALRRVGRIDDGKIADEPGDGLLRFLGRLSAFGLAAGREPLLKPATKPGS